MDCIDGDYYDDGRKLEFSNHPTDSDYTRKDMVSLLLAKLYEVDRLIRDCSGREDDDDWLPMTKLEKGFRRILKSVYDKIKLIDDFEDSETEQEDDN